MQVVRETELLKEPNRKSPSLGKLPKGTLATFLGDEKNGFGLIGVQLQQGNAEGWVRLSALSSSGDENVHGRGASTSAPVVANPSGGGPFVAEAATSAKKSSRSPNRAKSKHRARAGLPADEAALLHRDTTFFYGVGAGGNFSIMQATLTNYLGLGFTGGAFAGFYLQPNIPLRFEADYTLATGTGNNVTISFGFFEGAIELGYLIHRLEFFGGAKYSQGIGMGNLPTTIISTGPANFSNIYALGGVGYHIPLSDVSTLILRARYSISFLPAPVIFQFFTLAAYLEFGG